MKKIILYQNFYIDKNPVRQKELDLCLKKNIECKHIDKIVLITDLTGQEYVSKNFATTPHKIVMSSHSSRPTYNEYFELTQKMFPDNIHVISNTDIYFDETLEIVRNFNWESKKTCMAICRWNLEYNGEIVHYNAKDSQDVWIFYGAVQKMNEADFTMGLCGCDNKIAHIISENGYDVINPSLSIKTIHVHTSNIRNYNIVTDRVPGPYKIIEPSSI